MPARPHFSAFVDFFRLPVFSSASAANAEAETRAQLAELKRSGGKPAMDAYVRNAKLALFAQAQRVIAEVRP